MYVVLKPAILTHLIGVTGLPRPLVRGSEASHSNWSCQEVDSRDRTNGCLGRVCCPTAEEGRGRLGERMGT
jgi:hypothetical protein